MSTYTGKALNLEVLQHSKNKVTLGFKCNPLVKLTLAQEAERLGITLSEHVENIVVNRKQLINGNGEANASEETINKLKEKINFYENDFLKKLLDDNKGIPHTYIDANGETQTLTVNSMQDAFTVMTNSYRNEK